MAEHEFIADALAAFAVETRVFPSAALHEAKRLLLDQMTCQIAFAALPWSLAFRNMVLSLGGGGQATVVFHGDKVALDDAVFLNSAFGHGNEFDDTQLGSHTHSGAVIAPVALALAQTRPVSGEELLGALIVGVEIMVRLGAAAAPHLDERGFHAPPVVGPFGASGCASRLLGLTANQCAESFGVAGSHAGGTRQYTRGGGSVKRIHCAMPAMSGLRSAIMASYGITGPRSIFEGDRGILALFSGDYDLARITQGLGRDYLMEETAYKPITSPWPSHAPLEALGDLQRENDLSADDVVAVEIGSSAQAVNNIKTIRAPRDIMEAQYSLAYSVAVRLLRGGNRLHDYREEDLGDSRFHELAARVSFKVDQICDGERIALKNRSAVVVVTLNNGKRLERRVQFSKGHPRNPMSDADLTEKFMDSVAPILGVACAGQIADFVWRVDSAQDVGKLVAMTAPDRS